MTSSILVNHRDERILRSAVRSSLRRSIFFFIFYIIYNIFSHGVHSPFMTYLFVWPLALGALPSFLCLKVRRIPGPSVLSSLLWNTGIAAVTVSSMLRGIFEIAGNSWIYQHLLMLAGFLFLAAGLIVYAAGFLLFEARR